MEKLHEQKKYKYIRKAWKMPQAKMSRGVMSPSAYSKFERGVNDINANNLIKLVTSISLQRPEYPKPIAVMREENIRKNPRYYQRSLSRLEDEISHAQQLHDKSRLDELASAVKEENQPWLTLYLKAAYAWLKHSNEDITDEDRKQAKKLFFTDKMDSISLHFLGQYMILFDFDEIYPWIQRVFDEVKKISESAIDQFFTVAMVDLILKYFVYCYINNKTDEKYTSDAFEILFSMISLNVNSLLYKTIGQYYKALFNGDQETCDDIMQVLDYAGYRWVIEDTL